MTNRIRKLVEREWGEIREISVDLRRADHDAFQDALALAERCVRVALEEACVLVVGCARDLESMTFDEYLAADTISADDMIRRHFGIEETEVGDHG